MATLQKRKSHGHNYWYIVESRRVNGKSRPITLYSIELMKEIKMISLHLKKAFRVYLQD